MLNRIAASNARHFVRVSEFLLLQNFRNQHIAIMPRSDRGSSIYIGNLPPDFQKRDLEDLFSKYGRIQASIFSSIFPV